MNADNADNSLVSLTLPESVENEVHAVSSSLSNASSFLPAKRGFKMACLNINSLVKHVDELRVLLSEFSVDILAINETKLDESIKSSELHIPGYEFIRRDRSRNGGGVRGITLLDVLLCSIAENFYSAMVHRKTSNKIYLFTQSFCFTVKITLRGKNNHALDLTDGVAL